MKTKLNKEEIIERKESKSYRDYDNIEEFDNITSQYQVDESGMVFFDKDQSVVSMFKTDSIQETKSTIQRVVSVCELGEEEITKVKKIKHIIKGFLEICFRKKISVFLVSLGFIYMNYLGIKERMFLLNVVYTWGFFMITDTSKAVSWVKDTIEKYKLREEALSDEEFMEFYNSTLTDDVEDIRLYLKLSNTKEKRL